jgi:hypothetical protein
MSNRSRGRSDMREPKLTLFAELKRRNVFRVAVVYLGTAWLIVHVGTVLGATLETPHWVMRFVERLAFGLGSECSSPSCLGYLHMGRAVGLLNVQDILLSIAHQIEGDVGDQTRLFTKSTRSKLGIKLFHVFVDVGIFTLCVLLIARAGDSGALPLCPA